MHFQQHYLQYAGPLPLFYVLVVIHAARVGLNIPFGLFRAYWRERSTVEYLGMYLHGSWVHGRHVHMEFPRVALI